MTARESTLPARSLQDTDVPPLGGDGVAGVETAGAKVGSGESDKHLMCSAGRGWAAAMSANLIETKSKAFIDDVLEMGKAQTLPFRMIDLY